VPLIRIAVLGAMLFGCSLPAGAYEDGHEGDRANHGFGPHPSMPVPAALVFGGLAVSAAAVIARRRRGPKKDARPESSADQIDEKQ